MTDPENPTNTHPTAEQLRAQIRSSLARWRLLRGAACAGFWILFGAQAARAHGSWLATFIVGFIFASMFFAAGSQCVRLLRIASSCSKCESPCVFCLAHKTGARVR